MVHRLTHVGRIRWEYRMTRLSKFSAEEALEAHEDGEPIMITHMWVERDVRRHGSDLGALYDDLGNHATYDAWVVLAWLGY
jgi:hypothetical protein